MKPYQYTPPKSALGYILKSLVPYSHENMRLSFKPNLFYAELEKASGYRTKTLQNSLYRACKSGLVKKKGPGYTLTELGKWRAAPYIAKELGAGAYLMIIFDIPETMAAERSSLRWLLRRRDY